MLPYKKNEIPKKIVQYKKIQEFFYNTIKVKKKKNTIQENILQYKKTQDKCYNTRKI